MPLPNECPHDCLMHLCRNIDATMLTIVCRGICAGFCQTEFYLRHSFLSAMRTVRCPVHPLHPQAKTKLQLPISIHSNPRHPVSPLYPKGRRPSQGVRKCK
eukprot:1443594-Amphidinium_carterae.1